MSTAPLQPEQAAARGEPTAADKARLWRAENAEAIATSNRYVETDGLPLADFRRF